MSKLEAINPPTYIIDQFDMVPIDATIEDLMAHYWVMVSRAEVDLPGGLETVGKASILFVNKSNHTLDAALNIANVEADDLREELTSDNFDIFAREQDHNDFDWIDHTYDELLYNSYAWAQEVDNINNLAQQVLDGYNYIGVVDTDYKYIGADMHELFTTMIYNWGHDLSMEDNPPRINTGYLSVDGSKRG